VAAPQSGIPSWTLSTWVKWSWLLVVAFIVAQSLSYHWRVLPTSSAGYFARGRADYLSGDFENAVWNFTRSIERNPANAEAYIYRGEAYALQQDFGRALPDIAQALQLRPDYEKSHAADGDVKALSWDALGAREAYSRAIALAPDCSRCYLKRGLASYDAQLWGDASADFHQGSIRLLADEQITARLSLWLARARSGDASGATDELLEVMRGGRFRGDRFWSGAQFLTGQIAEPSYLAAVANSNDDDVQELKAEAFFLAGGRRLAFGDRSGAMTLMRNALGTGAESSYAYDRARVELESLLVGFHPMRTAPPNAGLAIASVTPGGPAEAAGLRPGDLLLSINGAGVSQESFLEFLGAAEPGSTVELRIENGAGASVMLPLTLTPGSSAPTR